MFKMDRYNKRRTNGHINNKKKSIFFFFLQTIAVLYKNFNPDTDFGQEWHHSNCYCAQN